MPAHLLIALTVLVIGALPQTASATKAVEARRTDTPPAIDGVLDDAVWAGGALINGMVQVDPHEGAEPTQHTEIRILYDDDNLYLAIWMFDEHPELIIAKQMVDDTTMVSDDRINLTFDTFWDKRNAYFFQINPVGTKSDALIENNQIFRRDWDGIWYAKSSVDDEGWYAEFAIPFKTVSFRVGGTVWGFEAERMIRRINERDRWANESRNRDTVNVAGIGMLTGLRGMDGVGVDLKPSFAASWDRTREETSDGGHHGDWDRHGFPAGDVFYKFLPSATAAITAKTNFLEAPPDDRLTNLTRFPLFFPERRDFFLQDAGIFQFAGLEGNGIPYFSRRIGRLDGEVLKLDGGLKLTGRQGPLSFGGLHVRIPEQNGIDSTDLSVGRIQLAVLDESAFGLIGTRGDPRDEVNNSVVGADFQYFNSGVRDTNNIVSGNLWVQHSSSTHMSGAQAAFGGELEYPNDRYNGRLAYKEIGENFDPRLGFVNRRDLRQYDAEFRYRRRPVDSLLRTVDHGFDLMFVTDRDNKLETATGLFKLLEIETNPNDRLLLHWTFNEERLTEPFEIDEGVLILPGDYRFNRYSVRVETSIARPVSGTAEVVWGDFFDGKMIQVNAKLELRPSPHLFVALEYEQSDGRAGQRHLLRAPARQRRRRLHHPAALLPPARGQDRLDLPVLKLRLCRGHCVLAGCRPAPRRGRVRSQNA
jgi:hypothetical protein